MGNIKGIKLELALFDDIKKDVKTAIDIKAKLESDFVNANGGLRAVSSLKANLKKAYDSAKEVGFEVPAEMKAFDKIANDLETFFNKVKSI
jgi:hypothetical protein